MIRKSLYAKISYVLVLPLVATAIVGADSLRMHSVVSAAASLRELVTAEASQDEVLGRTLSAHYFQLTEGDRLTGQIVGIDKTTGRETGVGSLNVYLVQRSEVQLQTTTDSQGRFITPSAVEPGAYTFCVAGKEGFLAYGIYVDTAPAAGGEETAPAAEAPDDNTLPAPDDNRRRGPYARISYQQVPAAQEQRIAAAVVPPEFTALQRIMQRYVPVSVDEAMPSAKSKINVEKSVIEGGIEVSLEPDGRLLGRIAPIATDENIEVRLREMNVFLIQDDEIYGRGEVDDNGEFEILDVEPGVYGFAAAGKHGFAALSFEATAPEPDVETRNRNSGPFRMASNKNESRRKNNGLEVAICLEEDIPFVREQIRRLNEDDEEVVAQADDDALPFGVPTGGPGGIGPIGSAGGFGDFVPLLEAGLAAWILAEAFDDRDGTRVLTPPVILPPVTDPPPVSPVQPGRPQNGPS